MKLSESEVSAIGTRFKRLVNSTTRRTAEGVTLANSPLHMKAFTAVLLSQKLAKEWEGTREELDVRLKEMEDSVVSDLTAADALVADFPPGTGNAFGHTSGTPVITGGGTACHKCGERLRLDLGVDPPVLPGPAFLKLEAGRDVLLFVMHPACFERVTPSSAERSRNAGLDFVRIDREEWMLLLDAKTVLSS